ncbi:hypothetical protein, partial [Pseudomonas aeruginosa]|uniref:hypothetical protein n=1 Tax=Pseudomonas aeruginosa TaxID=287 RepID=UPI00339614DA
MKGTVHPRRLLLCLVLVPALLAGLGAWQSWRAEQQAERLGAAQQRSKTATINITYDEWLPKNIAVAI